MPLPFPFSSAERPIFLMDGTAYMYRGFYANSSLQRSDGFPTGALTVVSRILVRILRQEKPAYFAFFKDGHGKNFRHEAYPPYKANRSAMPEALANQIAPIERMVKALGLHYEESQGCEADDCIASLADRFGAKHPIVIVSADKDLKQCLRDNVIMWDPAAKDSKIYTRKSVEEEAGIPVSIWADLQALTGDSVDNIPGVPGIGPKTAREILQVFPGLEHIRDRFSLVSPKHQKKLVGHLEEMFVYRTLTTLSTKECTHLTLDDIAVRPLDLNAALALAREFELRQLMQDIMALGRTKATGKDPDAGPELTLTSRAPARAGAQPAAAKTGSAGTEGDENDMLRASQGASLLDLARSSSVSSLATLNSASALPSCQGARLAIIWPEGHNGPCAVALERDAEHGAEHGADHAATDFLWQGPMADLARWSEAAWLVVVADAKELMKSGSVWRENLRLRAATKGLYDLGLAAYLFNPEEDRYTWQRIVGQASLPNDAVASSPGAVALAIEAWGRQRLERDGLARLYHELELPLTAVLADMEDTGISIDMAAFQNFLGEVRQEISTLTQSIYEQAGETFNLRSSQQLGEILYNKLGLRSSRKTRTGQASTSQEALESLAGNPVVDAILRFRKLEKMRSTYLEPLPRLTDRMGRLHTTFNQEATATGRLSSSNPNLQNIPVRGALGKRMRTCFVADKGSLLVSCDYSQIELRVLAHMSQDAELLGAFARDEDIHTRTAALIYELAPEEVSPDQRRNAKTINFGLIYGMGAQKLAREIGVSTTEAKDFIARYFEKLTGLKAFYERVEEEAKEHGFVTTIAGRRRPLPNITSNNNQEQALARRQAINTVIQGSAADIIKIAMCTAWQNADLRALGARMVLQVHDELVLEVPQSNARLAGELVVQIMENVQPKGVPFEPRLKVDWGLGENWGLAH